jgi:hypothetical protein
MAKLINPQIAVLDVFECDECGFHLGIDTSYIEQVEDLKIPCPVPSCSGVFDTSADYPEPDPLPFDVPGDVYESV